MSDAVLTQGTLLEVNAGAGFVAVGEALDWDGPGGEAAEIEVTHLRSPSKEFKSGLRDPGDFSFNVNWLPDDPGQLTLLAAAAAQLTITFRITFSDGSTDTFQGSVRRLRKSGAKDDVVRRAYTVRVTGDITEA